MEERNGKPFIGPSGSHLARALGEAKIGRTNVYCTNVLCCRPDGNKINSFESVMAIELCSSGLRAELQWLWEEGVRGIAPVGNTALKALGIDETITNARGFVYTFSVGKGKEFIVVPTYHPSYIMRGNSKEFDVWIADFCKLKDLVETGWRPPKENFIIQPTFEEWKGFVEKALDEDLLLGADIETTGLEVLKAKPVMCGFATSETDALVFPFIKKGGDLYWGSKQDKAVGLLKKILLNGKTAWMNAAFDAKILKSVDMPVGRIEHDIMLLQHAIHPELRKSLAFITSIYGKTPYWKDTLRDKKTSIVNMDQREVRTYNARDCVTIHQNLPDMIKDAKELEVYGVYREISIPLLEPIVDMMLNGIPVSRSKQAKFKKSLEEKAEMEHQELKRLSGVPDGFNFNSGDHLQLLFYGRKADQFKRAEKKLSDLKASWEGLSANKIAAKKRTKKYQELCSVVEVGEKTTPLPGVSGKRKRTKSGYKTDKEAVFSLQRGCSNRLEKLKNMKRKTALHVEEERRLENMAAFISYYREYAETVKMLSTYTSFPVGPDGRIHSTINIAGTATARLATKEPNIQNWGKMPKKVAVVPKGGIFVQADYSNLEARLLAYASNDTPLIEAFGRGENLHDMNTRDLFGLEPSDPMWKTCRHACKTYRFARNYGGGIESIYEKVATQVPELNLTFRKFKEIDETYRKKHPNYAKWYDRTVEEVTRTRKVRNGFGRQRIFLGTIDAIAREGVNTPIQSTAADVINKATIRLHERLGGDQSHIPAYFMTQIHDALVMELKDKSYLDDLVGLMKEEMERPVTVWGQEITLPVDFEIGECWGEMEPYEA